MLVPCGYVGCVGYEYVMVFAVFTSVVVVFTWIDWVAECLGWVELGCALWCGLMGMGGWEVSCIFPRVHLLHTSHPCPLNPRLKPPALTHQSPT